MPANFIHVMPDKYIHAMPGTEWHSESALWLAVQQDTPPSKCRQPLAQNILSPLHFEDVLGNCDWHLKCIPSRRAATKVLFAYSLLLCALPVFKFSHSGGRGGRDLFDCLVCCELCGCSSPSTLLSPSSRSWQHWVPPQSSPPWSSYWGRPFVWDPVTQL